MINGVKYKHNIRSCKHIFGIQYLHNFIGVNLLLNPTIHLQLEPNITLKV